MKGENHDYITFYISNLHHHPPMVSCKSCQKVTSRNRSSQFSLFDCNRLTTRAFVYIMEIYNFWMSRANRFNPCWKWELVCARHTAHWKKTVWFSCEVHTSL